MSQYSRLPIPKSLSDVNSAWLIELVKIIEEETTKNLFALTHLQILPFESNSDSMFDRCRVSVDFEHQGKKHYKWIVQIIPQKDPDIKEIIVKHRLFEKCLLIHGGIRPALAKYVKGKEFEFELPLQKLIYGDYEDGCGVIVIEDWSVDHFKVDQPDLLRLVDPNRIENVVRVMAKYHAVASAFHIENNLEKSFTLLGEEIGSIWFHDDMKSVLDEMYSTCLSFLKSVPGQEQACQWFENKMNHPTKLKQKDEHLKTLIHGDLWHNNILFNEKSQILFNDWQMCHLSTPANDLCFFLFSSTTTEYRQCHWDSILKFYYETYISVLKTLGLSDKNFSFSFDDFLCDVKASVPLCLFFSLNMKDMDPAAEPEVTSYAKEMDQVFCFGSSSTLEGSLHRLQTYLSFIQVNEMTDTIFELEIDSDDFRESDDSDSDGIVLNFGQTSQKKKKRKSKSIQLTDVSTSDSANQCAGPSRPLSKVPTVATDQEIEAVLESRKRKNKYDPRLSPRKARAIRRKLYLDLYKEASNRMFI